ncbi:MAG: DUF2807 domain-containing protein [Planctomycetota bacterium]
MRSVRALPCVAVAGLFAPLPVVDEPRAIDLVGMHTTESLPVDGDIEGVAIDGFGTLRVTIADEVSLTVTTDAGYLERVEHAVVEDADSGYSVLKLGNVAARDGLRPMLVFDLTVPSLSYLHASGLSVLNAGNVDLKGESVTVLASGKGRVMAGTIEADVLNLQASGGAWIRIDGVEVDDLAVDAHGGSLVVVEEDYLIDDELVMLTGSARFESPRTRAVAAADPR